MTRRLHVAKRNQSVLQVARNLFIVTFIVTLAEAILNKVCRLELVLLLINTEAKMGSLIFFFSPYKFFSSFSFNGFIVVLVFLFFYFQICKQFNPRIKKDTVIIIYSVFD